MSVEWTRSGTSQICNPNDSPANFRFIEVQSFSKTARKPAIALGVAETGAVREEPDPHPDGFLFAAVSFLVDTRHYINKDKVVAKTNYSSKKQQKELAKKKKKEEKKQRKLERQNNPVEENEFLSSQED